MFSAAFMPLHAGSWLISIFEPLGAAPSNFTVPLTVATVAGSMGVAAGVAAGCSADGLEAGASSFLLHAASTSKPHRASMPTIIIFQPVFLFIMSPFLEMGIHVIKNFVIPNAERQRRRRNLLSRAPTMPPDNQTDYSTATLRSAQDVAPLSLACDRSSAAQPLSRAASPKPPAAALRPSVGKCNPSTVSGGLLCIPGTKAESARQTPTGSPAA